MMGNAASPSRVVRLCWSEMLSGHAMLAPGREMGTRAICADGSQRLCMPSSIQWDQLVCCRMLFDASWNILRRSFLFHRIDFATTLPHICGNIQPCGAVKRVGIISVVLTSNTQVGHSSENFNSQNSKFFG